MTSDPVFLSTGNVVDIHRRMIRDFGGAPQVREQGLLESAVMLPSARFGGEFLHAGLPAMAAAYLFHICRNHPFVDGNKRTALASAEIFLLLNGYTLAADDAELETLTMGVASGSISKEEVVTFFSRHAQPGGEGQ